MSCDCKIEVRYLPQDDGGFRTLYRQTFICEQHRGHSQEQTNARLARVDELLAEAASQNGG